ncbi:hypothetical protein [Novosphingobium kaempferiae]|uniref:hypothetical protein n=1 Tax=Novosphingobium kaempferiae TaxID=2896849 RepID=UPI001E356EBC|nr:hypothetical protein [Novosphingobium kaempferiae]
MTADRKKLARLNRLEKLRAIAKQAAATEAAQAEGTLAQLQNLSERTQRLASEYAARRDAVDGATLHQVGRFVGGLRTITRTTDGEAERARSIADAKQQQLIEAERRRAAIEDRAAAQARVVAAKAQQPVLGGKRRSGTEIE